MQELSAYCSYTTRILSLPRIITDIIQKHELGTYVLPTKLNSIIVTCAEFYNLSVIFRGNIHNKLGFFCKRCKTEVTVTSFVCVFIGLINS